MANERYEVMDWSESILVTYRTNDINEANQWRASGHGGMNPKTTFIWDNWSDGWCEPLLEFDRINHGPFQHPVNE